MKRLIRFLVTWYRLASGKTEYYYYEKESDKIQVSYEYIVEMTPRAKKEVFDRYRLNLEVKKVIIGLYGSDVLDGLTTYVIVLGKKK